MPTVPDLRLARLLAHAADHLTRTLKTTLLAALHQAAAFLGYSEGDVEAALTLLDCAPDIVGYHAHDLLTVAWNKARGVA